MTRDLLAQPRRIAFAGDWHADESWAVDAVYAAANKAADVIVHLGDFGYQFRPKFLTTLNAALADTETPLLFIDGNHDNHRWLNRLPIETNGLRLIGDWIWHIPRGFRWMWGELRFLGLGGAHSVDGTYRRQAGLMWQPEERITDIQAQSTINGGPADVLIAHDCPAGVQVPGLTPHRFPQFEVLRGDEHRTLLRKVVDRVRPQIIWHGHYHVRYDATVDFGYGPVQVHGLNSNDTRMRDNLQVVELADLQRHVKADT